MAIIINLYGGACAGKSTTAAGLFHRLKTAGYQAEYVTEFAKDIVYDKAFNLLDDQIYVFAEQQHRLRRCLAKNDFVIMDSPILLSIIYDKSNNTELHWLIIGEYLKYKNIDVFLNRTDTYNRNSRVETKERALRMDNDISQMLDLIVRSYHKVDVDVNTVDNIWQLLVQRGCFNSGQCENNKQQT